MTKQGIVVGATPGRTPWLVDMLASLDTGHYPVLVINTWDFEIAVFQEAVEHFDEFVFLPMTCIVKDNSLWYHMFEGERQSISLSNTPCPFGMFFGKYLSEDVREIGFPPCANKFEAILQERAWTEKYAALRPYKAFADLPDSWRFENKYGRKNMVVENQWMKKWKGSWDLSSAQKDTDLDRERRIQVDDEIMRRRRSINV